MGQIFEMAKEFKRRHPGTVAWRLRKNSSIIEKHLNPDEIPKYVFCAQKNDNPFNIIGTAVVALTNKRLMIGRDRIVFGYFLDSITPDLFNDLKVKSGVIWGKIEIDTVKEHVILSNVGKGALAEIETAITQYMIREKRRMLMRHQHSEESNV